MATLFNTKISATYEGLLKTIDNAAISATLRELTDGSGNQSGLYLNTAGDFKVTNILEWGSLKDTGTGVTITQFVTSTDGIENFNNNTTLPTSAAVKLYVDTKFASSDTLEEVLVFGNTTSGNDIAVSAGDDITFTDTSKILMGASSDLQIYHDAGGDSYIKELGSGQFYIQAENFRFKSADGTSSLITANVGGAVNLYYNNSKKLETTNLGAEVTGDLVVTGTITGSGGSFLPLAGGTMTGNIVLNDNVRSIYGTASDGLQIFHNGTDSLILDSGTGNLRILGSTSVRIQNQGDNADMIVANSGNGVNLYYNNSKKLETTNTGATVTGALTTTTNISVGADATFVDNGKAQFGTSNDLQIYHDGSDSFIANATGDLKLSSTNFRILKPGLGEFVANFFSDGANEFFYDGTKRLETLTDGAKVTGNLEVTGTITGAGGSFLPLIGGTMTGDIVLNDNIKTSYGASVDFEIYHNASTNSNFIQSNSSRQLTLAQDNIFIGNQAASESMITAVAEGAVQLYYDNANKLETTDTGILVLGDGVFFGNVSIPDSGQLLLGSGNDAQLSHNGTNFKLNSNNGDLYIDQAATTQSIIFRTSDANALDTTALIINRGGDLTTGRDVTIAGDLTVNGTTTTVNSQTLSVDDPLISLAINNDANSLDIGYYGKYNDATTRYLGLFNDSSDSNKFKLFKGTTVEPTTTVNIGAAGYVAADLQVAGLEATTGTFIGNVTSNSTTAFSVGTIGNIGNTANDLNIYSTTAGHNGLRMHANGVLPTDNTGTIIDNDADLGEANYRFKDLYLGGSITSGGGATFAGTVAATSYFLGTASEISLATTGAGSIFLRPNGQSTSGQMKLESSGNATFAGAVGVGVTGGSNAKLEVASTSGEVFRADSSGGAFRLVVDQTGVNTQGVLTHTGNLTVNGITESLGLRTDTANTNYNLISRDSAGNAPLYVQSANNNTNQQIAIFNYGSADANQGTNILTVGKDFSYFQNTNVGIGTTSPDAKLEVVGDVLISSGEYLSWGTAGATSIEGSTASNKLQFRTSSTDRMIINDTGVGIGTNSPVKKFHVKDTSGTFEVAIFETNSGGSFIRNIDSTGTVETGIQGGKWSARTSNTQRLVIDSTGNVGIGTTSPDGVLEVVTTNDNRYIKFKAPNGEERFKFYTGGTGNASRLDMYSSDGTTQKIQISAGGNSYFNTGNLGIGTTSPDYKLEVQGEAGIELYNGTGGGSVLNFRPSLGDANKYNMSISSYDHSGGGVGPADGLSINGFDGVSFATGSSTSRQERMRITSAGKVGIGKNNPVATLDVAGPIWGEGTFKLFNSSTQFFSISSNGGAPYIQGAGGSGDTVYFGAPVSNVTNIQVQGVATATNFIVSSDRTLKDNIKEIEINNINVNWKNFELISEPGVKRAGVIAQELEETNPEFVRTDKDGLKSVAYIDLLITKIAELEARLQKLELK